MDMFNVSHVIITNTSEQDCLLAETEKPVNYLEVVVIVVSQGKWPVRMGHFPCV